MSFFKFHEDDLFVNTVRTEPQYSFYIYSGSVFIDNVPNEIGTRDTTSDNIYGVPQGHISLYEINIDRPSTQRIYPFVYKDGKRNSFKTISQKDYDSQYLPGDMVTSSYNMSASISREYISLTTTAARRKILALRNTFEHYRYLSPHYAYSSEFGNKAVQRINLVAIPTVFYGSSIKKGTVKLDFYISGSLVGRLRDTRRNGELVQESGLNSANDGKVAGVVLYNEGFIVLTGSWNISDNGSAFYTYDGLSTTPKWRHWGYGANDGNTPSTASELSSSFLLEYTGSSRVQTLTMLAHANYNEVNHSNNPTFLSASNANKIDILSAHTGAYQYIEKPLKIKNVVSASYTDQEPPFEKTTYITKVAIYDKHKNLIGIAKLAQPVRKTEDVNYTFKIKLDI